MRIVFMGTPDFAIPSLNILVEAGHDVVGVITAPDRPAGRGLQLKPSPVKAFALEKGLKVLQPEKLRDPDFLAELRGLNAELAVVVAFRMLPEVVWGMPPLGTFNLHASLLPDYRGAAPINWAIMNGEKESGVTTFFLEKEIDTGGILLQEKVQIPKDWTAGDLHDALMEKGAQLVLKTVKGIEKGQLKGAAQVLREGLNAAPKIFKDDCKIDWTKPAEQVHNLIRGLSPFPTAWTTLWGQNLKIYKAEVATLPTLFEEAVKPGKIVVDRRVQSIYIACWDRWIQVYELQLEGKKRVDAKSFANGMLQTLMGSANKERSDRTFVIVDPERGINYAE